MRAETERLSVSQYRANIASQKLPKSLREATLIANNKISKKCQTLIFGRRVDEPI